MEISKICTKRIIAYIENEIHKETELRNMHFFYFLIPKFKFRFKKRRMIEQWVYSNLIYLVEGSGTMDCRNLLRESGLSYSTIVRVLKTFESMCLNEPLIVDLVNSAGLLPDGSIAIFSDNRKYISVR